MSRKFIKQSQITYLPFFQFVAAIFGRLFGKNECYPPMNSEIIKTKPNKAKRAKSITMREMYEKFRKQSQTTYHTCFQCVAPILGPFFGKNECVPSMISEWRETKPNKAKLVKCLIMREMREKFRKQSQMNYPACFQLVERVLGPIFEKNECNRPMNWPGGAQRTKPSKAKCGGDVLSLCIYLASWRNGRRQWRCPASSLDPADGHNGSRIWLVVGRYGVPDMTPGRHSAAPDVPDHGGL
jgi:hypothetical protein